VPSSPDGAAALHGALWVYTGTPIELITPATRPPRGILARDELISDDELVLIDGMAVTNRARTAFDLARHLHRDLAVRHLDALARGPASKQSTRLRWATAIAAHVAEAAAPSRWT
jgi:hypothetical protein